MPRIDESVESLEEQLEIIRKKIADKKRQDAKEREEEEAYFLRFLSDSLKLSKVDRGALFGFLSQNRDNLNPENPEFAIWKVVGDKKLSEMKPFRKNRRRKGSGSNDELQ